MTDTYHPFDAGAGAIVTESQWSDMARYWLRPGVIMTGSTFEDLNGLSVFADSTGMQVKLRSGKAYIQGHFFKRDAEAALAIPAAHATLPRIDLVVLRLERSANAMYPAVIQGTAAASPVVPSPVVTDSDVYDIPLAQVAVGAAVSTITAGNVTDRRTAAYGLPPQSYSAAGGSTATMTAGTATDIPDMTVSAFTPNGVAVVRFSSTVSTPTPGAFGTFHLNVDNGADVLLGQFHGKTANYTEQMSIEERFSGLAPGTHVFKARAAANGGTISLPAWRRLIVIPG